MGEQPSNGKRKRVGLDAETESESEADDTGAPPTVLASARRNDGGGRAKERGQEKRREQLGKRQVDKEVYRKDKIRRVDEQGKQWTR